MKPSEIKARDKQVEERTQLLVSDDADPPITEAALHSVGETKWDLCLVDCSYKFRDRVPSCCP